jgi:hypothetical protein
MQRFDSSVGSQDGGDETARSTRAKPELRADSWRPVSVGPAVGRVLAKEELQMPTGHEFASGDGWSKLKFARKQKPLVINGSIAQSTDARSVGLSDKGG